MSYLWKGGVLEKEKECKTNPAGNGYAGTTSISSMKETCTSWTRVKSDTIAASLAVDDVAKAKNYCRKLAGSKRTNPSCVISGAKQMESEEYCNINFCGKLYFNVQKC